MILMRNYIGGIKMKKYEKPILVIDELLTTEVILSSNIELNNSNAGFDMTDEIL